MQQIPADIVALEDYERYARERLDPAVWAYLAGAGADGLTQRWNREAFDAIRLRGRVLAPLAEGHTRLELLGLQLPHPILLAPVAFQRLAHGDGEAATVLGAAAGGAVMTVSTQASLPLEDLAQIEGHGPLWFQLYFQAERAATLSLVRRAETAGYQALVVTLDAPVNGLRSSEQRAGFRLPQGLRAVNLDGLLPAEAAPLQPGDSPVFQGLLARAPGWENLAWLRAETRLPLVAKGILDAEDAKRAVALGVDALVVSNHGGRTLDGLPASIEALAQVAEAVDGRVPVLLDGGIRRGTDILKALALGARAVLLGQPVMHALAVGGAVGVAHMLTILHRELEVAMALTGCGELSTIGPEVLWSGRTAL